MMKVFIITEEDIKNNRLDPAYILARRNQLNPKYAQIKIKEIIDRSFSGGTPNTSIHDYWEGNIPWISPKDFKNIFITKSVDHISEDALKNSSTKMVKENSVLIVVRSGILKHTLPVAINLVPVAINQDIKALELKDIILPKYLAYYLSVFSNKILPLITKHSTTVQSINTDQFDELDIPLPPIPIQEKIIRIMDDAYAKKKNNEEEAERLMESIDDFVLEKLGIIIPESQIYKYFSVNAVQFHNNRFDVYYHLPKFKLIFDSILNGKYEAKILKKYIEKIHYGVSIKNVYFDKGIPLLRILNLKPNHLDLDNIVYLSEDVKSQVGTGFVKEGDLLISRSGSIGNVAVVPKEADGYAFGSFMIKITLNDHINKFYISMWLNNKLMQQLIQREKIGAIQGNITIPTIENFVIPIPPEKVQQEIVNEFNLIYEKAESLKREAYESLEQAKKEVEKILFE